MKKYISISLAVMALTLAGCARGPFSEEDVNVITIKAVMAENNTRTVIQEGTTSVLWEQADEIKVFYDGIGSRFANQNTSPSGTAKFSGSLNVVFGSNEGFSDSTPLWGLYPYRADATADNTSVTTTLPAEQTGRAGSFAKGMNITLGKSSSLVMGFYNVCGGIRFSLTQEGVKDVIFEGQNNENIAGKVKIAFADGVPAVQDVIEGQKTITLSAPSGGTFETGKWYYIVALPGTLANGFKMTFNTDTQYATLKSSGAKTIKRGIFGSLADADEDLIYKDKEGGDPQTGNIVFADPAAKYACVTKYDTNGDGEVSYEEAETVTSFDGLFTLWTTVKSFDEIRYFKNVHSLSGVFNGCNKLVSITVPENITSLGTYAFSGCSALTSVALSSGISSIGEYSFYNCSSLISVDIPSDVAFIGKSAFQGCSSLATVELPAGITSIADYTFQDCVNLCSVGIPSGMQSIGNGAFYNCSSLVEVVIPDAVSSLGEAVFSGCSSLSSVVLPSGITSIPKSCFENCVAMTSISIPSGVTSVGEKAFYRVKMWRLEFPASVTSLGQYSCGSAMCVILPSSTPVTAHGTCFFDVSGIFVPAHLIDMYKVMSGFESDTFKLHPLDAYKERSEFTLVTSGIVDMGTSVKWAACNLGATSPEELGDCYAWGETEVSSYSSYSGDWDAYFDNPSGDGETFIRYFNGEGGKTTLLPGDDVAHVKLGESWHMPTVEEFEEFLATCLCEPSTLNGVTGSTFYSLANGNAIFLPDNGSLGSYWSSSLHPDYSDRAYNVMIEGVDLIYYPRCYIWRAQRYARLPIRPVCD